MSVSRLMQMAAAGAAAVGGALAIEDVFSTYLYTGTGSAQTITNGIDLAGEGGMVWIKCRDGSGTNHSLFDTVRGVQKRLQTNTTAAEATNASYLTAFNSDGFSIGSDGDINSSVAGYTSLTSWTFRKAPRFFDVVTVTATATQTTFNHNLGAEPACVIIKCTNATQDWFVYHKDVGSSAYLRLNATSASAAYSNWCVVTDTTVTVLGGVMGTGNQYVAYLFAHDPLGPSGDGSDGLIACGSYTGTGANGNSVSVGWEPQWVLVKRTDVSGYGWFLIDNMRGMPSSTGGSSFFRAELSNAESTLSTSAVAPTPTGLEINGTSAAINASGGSYIYIAIRRGPMRQPTSGTEVFATVKDPVNPNIPSSILVDTQFIKSYSYAPGQGWFWHDRLRQSSGRLDSSTTDSETTGSLYNYLDFTFGQTGTVNVGGGFGDPGYIAYHLRRAPGFFDVVAWTAGSSTNRRLSHNLEVTPEFAISKSRSNAGTWWVYHKDLGSDKYINLDLASAASTLVGAWPSPTETEFGVRESHYFGSGWTVITYLFASCPGVSKVGSYTGNGTSQTINCGFTSGARFILIKRTDSTGDWYVWDTARGIVAANDPHLSLNTTAAEVTTDDSVDPDSSGFIVNQVAATNINVSSASYIYLAIA